MKWTLYLATLALALTSCERRDLTYDYQGSASIKLNIDWSELGDDDEQPHYLKAHFYPVDGSEVIERYIDWGGETINVPYGEYRVIIYTWRINASAQTVQFRGDEFDTFEAYTDEVTRSKNRAKSGVSLEQMSQFKEQKIISSPDNYLYSWSSREEMILLSRSTIDSSSKSDGVDIEGSISLNVAIENQIEHYNVSLDIENAGSAVGINSAVANTRSGVLLGSGAKSSDIVSTDIAPTFVDGGNDLATFNFRIATFGALPEDGNLLTVQTINADGITTSYATDISEVIEKTQSGEIKPNAPTDITDPDNPMVVPPSEKPPGDGGFKPPVVGDWVDGGTVVIPM